MSNKRRAIHEVREEQSSSDDEENVLDNMNPSDDSSLKLLKPNFEFNLNDSKTRKRGRYPSDKPCTNRNALLARENRQRKKEYLKNIESTLSFYQEKNKNLTGTIEKQEKDIKRLTKEVTYLKSVLNNNSRITALLKLINDGLGRLDNEKKRENQNYLSSHSSEGVQFSTSNPRYQSLCPNQEYMARRNYVGNGKLYNFQTGEIHNVNKNRFNCKGSTYMIFFSLGPSPHSGMTTDDHLLENMLSNSVHKKADTGQAIQGEFSKSMDQPVLNFYSENTDKKFDYVIENMSSINENKDLHLGHLPSFDISIFENIPNYNEISTSYSHSETLTNSLNEEEMFQNFDKSGICLHVNSNKISLELCATCNSHSKNNCIESQP